MSNANPGREWEEQCNASCTAIPLTTTFVPPSSCSQYWTPNVIGTAYITSGQGPAIAFTRNYTVSDCVPSQVHNNEPSKRPCTECKASAGIPWISPGLCPQGWPAASTGILSGVTTGYCCPPEAPTYGLATNTSSRTFLACTGTASAGIVTLSFNSSVYTTSSRLVSGSLTTFNISTVTQIRTTTYLYGARYTAAPIVVQYKQEDFTTATGAASLESPTDSPINDSGGLTMGAKAGIGVGAALGALALLALGFLIYKRRQKRRVVHVPAQEDWAASGQKAELHNEPVQPKELPAHADGYTQVSPGYTEVNPRDPAELGGYR